MSWRVAESLNALLDEVNAAAPNRSKASDGSLGDLAHSARVSQHNPDRNGVVRARDITDDPGGGHSADKFAEWLRKTQDPRVLYVIDQYRMFSSYPTSTHAAWTWRPYNGVNAHTKHTHISVVESPRLYDSTKPWGWATPKERSMFVKKGDSGQQVRYWQRRLNRAVIAAKNRINPDGDYGKATIALVAKITGTDGQRIGPREADRIEAAVTSVTLRQALKSVPNAQVDVDALAAEVAQELTIGVKP